MESDVTDQDVHKAVVTLLRYLGEDPSRAGLKETPMRVGRAFAAFRPRDASELERLLSVQFSETNAYDGVVRLDNITFSSLCEHHLMPFFGQVSIVYQPRGAAVVGLSKLARLVDFFSCRLQLQERLTADILLALKKHLNPLGAYVSIEAMHTCLSTRGALKSEAKMFTEQGFGTLQKGVL